MSNMPHWQTSPLHFKDSITVITGETRDDVDRIISSIIWKKV